MHAGYSSPSSKNGAVFLYHQNDIRLGEQGHMHGHGARTTVRCTSVMQLSTHRLGQDGQKVRGIATRVGLLLLLATSASQRAAANTWSIADSQDVLRTNPNLLSSRQKGTDCSRVHWSLRLEFAAGHLRQCHCTGREHGVRL